MDEHRDIRPECKEQFEILHRRIEKRDKLLDEQDEKIQSHSVSIAKMSENIIAVTRSINALTKALWGLAGSMIVTLAGFVLWYIQSL